MNRFQSFMFQGIFMTTAVLGGLQPVAADTIISNYPATNDNSASPVADRTGNFAKAAGFTMSDGGAYTLNSITLRLERNDADATLLFQLFGDGGSGPVGPPLLTFINPLIPVGGPEDFVFLPNVVFDLQPLTTYWIAGTGTSPTINRILWYGSFPGITPTGIATSAGYRFNLNGTFPPTGDSSPFNTYQVDGTPVSAPVPEPSTMLLLGSGLIGLVAWRKKATV